MTTNINDFQYAINQIINKVASYEEKNNKEKLTINALALVGEAGEIANKFKKILRGDEIVDPYGDIAKEAGDVLWYLAGLAEVLGVNLEDIAQNNLDKLADRKRRGAIEGFGDDR